MDSQEIKLEASDRRGIASYFLLQLSQVEISDAQPRSCPKGASEFGDGSLKLFGYLRRFGGRLARRYLLLHLCWGSWRRIELQSNSNNAFAETPIGFRRRGFRQALQGGNVIIECLAQLARLLGSQPNAFPVRWSYLRVAPLSKGH